MANLSKYVDEYASPKGLKIFLSILAFILIIVFGKKLIAKLKSWFIPGGLSAEEQANIPVLQKGVDDITKDVNTNDLPEPYSFYQGIALKQFKAMDGWGTDWSTLITSLKRADGKTILSPKELRAVYKAYGVRTNTDFTNEPFDLFGTYNDEYSSFSPTCLVYWGALKEIWKTSGLPITF